MRATRVGKSRTILFDGLPKTINGFDVRLNKGCQFEIEVKYTGDSNVWSAIVLDDCIIPAIIDGVNAQHNKGDLH